MENPRILPAFPKTQALNSTTFTPPPLDGSLTLPQIYDWHREHSPNHRLFVYACEDGTVKEKYWPEVVGAMYTGAKIIHKRVQHLHKASGVPLVAILSTSDTISYWMTIMSIQRANCAFFPISIRNSAPAIAHLIAKTGVHHLLVGREASMQNLANDALRILEDLGQKQPESSAMPAFEDYFVHITDAEIEDIKAQIPIRYRTPDEAAAYFHSSGSTAYPKPIKWSYSKISQVALVPWFGERDLTNQVWASHAITLFHGFGFFHVTWTASSGIVIAVFEPQSPAIQPSPENLYHAALATKSDLILSAPSILTAWVRRPTYVKWLASRTGLVTGGGPLDKGLGDYLVSEGVRIFVAYGTTECGIMTLFLPKEVDKEWEYFRFSKIIQEEMLPSGDGAYELVVVESAFTTPSVVNTKVNGIDGYATSDLLVQHPTKPGFWKIYGRADDQIMHNTGEKTNPTPLENMMNQDPHVAASVMFGRGQFQAGILVEPQPQYRFNPANLELLEDFRNRIWPTVEKMNAYAPQHSRLFKEMIMVVKPEKPFTYTAKDTVRRQAILNDYAEEIKELYATVEESTQVNVTPPAEWNTSSATEFVRKVVGKVLVQDVNEYDDLFQHGCDSLQATWIRNSILGALRASTRVDTRQATGNFVYDYPSVVQLGSFIASVANHGFPQSERHDASRIDAMHIMVKKYSQNFPNVQNGKSDWRSSGKVVLLTGSTGNFGAHVLADLISDSNVSRIYSLIRNDKTGTGVKRRQENAFLERGLDVRLLQSEKVVLLEARLSDDKFGVDHETFNEMSKSVTHIVANAWRVDFNIGLPSFESDIKSLRAMVDLALTTGSSLVFISSIGILQNSPEGSPVSRKEARVDAEMAVGTGYTESKWVSEQVIQKASSDAGLHSVIVRLGQICGSPNGAWSAKEWAPSMIQSAMTLGLPDDERIVTWIPAEMASHALLDLLDAPLLDKTDNPRFVHLVHPHPVKWTELAKIIASHLNVPLLSYGEWFGKLTKAAMENNAERKIPAVKILHLFADLAKSSTMEGESREAFGFAKVEIDNMIAMSKTLADPELPQLGEEDVRKWLQYWKLV